MTENVIPYLYSPTRQLRKASRRSHQVAMPMLEVRRDERAREPPPQRLRSSADRRDPKRCVGSSVSSACSIASP